MHWNGLGVVCEAIAPQLARLVVLALLLAADLGRRPVRPARLAARQPADRRTTGRTTCCCRSSAVCCRAICWGCVVNGDDRPVRAIVRGDVAAIQAAAARDGIPVLRVLDGIVVVEATPSAARRAAERRRRRVDLARQHRVSPTDVVSRRRWRRTRRARRSGGLLGALLRHAGRDRQGHRRRGRRLGHRISHAALTGKVIGVGELRDRRRRAPTTRSATARTSPASSPASISSAPRRSTRAASRPARTWSTCACSAATASATPATSSPASSGSSRTASSTRIRVMNLSLGHPHVRAVRLRSAVPRRGECGRPRAWWWWRRPATPARTPTAARCSAASRRPATRRA